MNATMLLGASCMLVSCVAYASALKTEATCVSETCFMYGLYCVIYLKMKM
jgi:hypothetical protein